MQLVCVRAVVRSEGYNFDAGLKDVSLKYVHDGDVYYREPVYADAIRTALYLLGISEEGIIFDDRFPDPVHIIFVIASSPTKESLYLRAVASILSWVHDADFRAMLLSGEECGDVTRFFNMLRTQTFVPRA